MLDIDKELKRGIITENPILILALGLCPSLAVSTSAHNGLGMGIAVMMVLAITNVIISIAQGWIPSKVRIPCYIVIIATFVTILQMFMKVYTPTLDRQLGIFIPLIAVNCIIMARAEAYASKNNPLRSFVDGIVMGLGFTLALVLLSVLREFLGNNKIFDLLVIPGFQPMTVFILAPGGFFIIAFVMALVNIIKSKKETKAKT
ncbi:MAG: electron transport complex subunit E [Chitinispirillia bacterium]|nr:electron transport complex subunit E [Chitinispirillia bacterium]MCL2268655.1 electron transport complex subunit E [Chitinispirillia bacterium]